MVVKDPSGYELEIHVGGKHSDDIQITFAAYLDRSEDVPDSTIDWLMDTYFQDIYQEWMENQQDAAESYSDYLKGN